MLPTRSLRPRSVAELLDTAFWLYRSHFWTLIGIAALVHVPLAILPSNLTLIELPAWYRFPFIDRTDSQIIFPVLWYVTFGNLSRAALINAIHSRYIVGTPTSLFASYRIDLRRYLVFFIVGCVPGIIYFIRTMTPSIWVFRSVIAVCCTLSQVPQFLLLWLSMYVLFVPQISLLECRGVLTTLRRSVQLAKVLSKRTFIILFATTLLGWLPVYLLLFAHHQLLNTMSFDYSQIGLLLDVFVLCIPIIIVPIETIIYTLLYYDLRVRHDGYDLELALAQPSSA